MINDKARSPAAVILKDGTQDPRVWVTTIYMNIQYVIHVVVQLAEALCYKLEGGGFDSRWCHWNFTLT